VLYCHFVRVPLFADFDNPEKYGFARASSPCVFFGCAITDMPQQAYKTTNVKIDTPDGETLGAWFTLSDTFYQAQPHPRQPLNSTGLAAALRARPTVLYLHGNAGTRAVSTRVAHARAFSSRLRTNVLALDYRGFGDSTGTPSEDGLTTDAGAAFEWLIEAGAAPEDVMLVGTSLGTGVAVQAAAQLLGAGRRMRGVALLAPFSSIAELLDTYYILGVVPLLKPLQVFPPGVVAAFKSLLRDRFDSLGRVPELETRVLVAHAEDDWDIPAAHSAALFRAFVE
ncbi:Alpha/Beta hydrolase protein, partial [Vararia minispora EC-137]